MRGTPMSDATPLTAQSPRTCHIVGLATAVHAVVARSEADLTADGNVPGHIAIGRGGMVCNTLSVAAALGARAAGIIASGDDAAGALMRKIVDDAGITAAHVITRRTPTTVTMLKHDHRPRRKNIMRGCRRNTEQSRAGKSSDESRRISPEERKTYLHDHTTAARCRNTHLEPPSTETIFAQANARCRPSVGPTGPARNLNRTQEHAQAAFSTARGRSGTV